MLLLDLKMPRLGGLQFLSWLETQAKPDFAVIILTGSVDLQHMREAYRLGAHSFLLKPVQYNDCVAFFDKFKGIEVEQCSTTDPG
jgi:DNA-binding NarL/FixJ family response regulator